MMIMRHEYDVNNDQYIAVVIGNEKTNKDMGWIQLARLSIMLLVHLCWLK